MYFTISHRQVTTSDVLFYLNSSHIQRTVMYDKKIASNYLNLNGSSRRQTVKQTQTLTVKGNNNLKSHSIN